MNKVLVIDPRNTDQIKLLNTFDSRIKTIDLAQQTKISNVEYKELQKKGNIVEQEIIIEPPKGEKDSCYIVGEKDIKKCTISFAPIQNKQKSRNIILLAINQSFKILGMETIIVNVEEQDTFLKRQLEYYGFESLGDVEGKETYIKEKEDENELGSIVNGNIKKH